MKLFTNCYYFSLQRHYNNHLTSLTDNSEKFFARISDVHQLEEVIIGLYRVFI